MLEELFEKGDMKVDTWDTKILLVLTFHIFLEAYFFKLLSN